MKTLSILFGIFSVSLSLENTLGERTTVPMHATSLGRHVLNVRSPVYSGALFGRDNCNGCGKSFTLYKAKLIQAQLFVALAAINVVAVFQVVSRARRKDIFVVVVEYAMEMTHVVEAG